MESQQQEQQQPQQPQQAQQQQIALSDVEIKDENIALNVMVAMLNMAQKRGTFSMQESSKCWECIQKFVKNAPQNAAPNAPQNAAPNAEQNVSMEMSEKV